MLKSNLVKKDAAADVVDIVKDAGKYKEDYGLVYEGFLKIDKAGPKTFSVMSNDDTRVYLEEKLIIDNDKGRHAKVAKTKTVNLKKGMYKIRIVYYQDDGGRLLDLKWENSAGKLVLIPADKLYIKK